MVSNFLPPDSQPWARSLESRLSSLESTTSSLKKIAPSRLPSAVSTPDNRLTISTPPVPGEGVLNGSLEHLEGVYTLRYGHEFHGLTQYVLIVSGKASGTGELSLLGPEGQVLDSDTLEIDTDVDDAIGFYFAVEFPVLTMNYEFEPEDGDGGGPDTDQEVVASYVLPDTGTLSLVTGATLDELSYEIRSASSSQVTVDTSSGVPTITGLSADGTTLDVMHDYSGTLEFLEETALGLETAQQELADARAEAEQNFGELDDKLGQAFPDDIFDVNLAIEQMANGKNAASYTDVADSVAEPGPTPTLAMGEGRRQFDVHRNRRSNGQIIGEWIWTGTAWTRLTLSDAMLSSLDVGKLTAGTANIETAVVNKLWGQLGVFDKLDVRTDAYISGTNLKDGAVTARTLNVVPEEGEGGLQLKSDGMMVIDAEGNGTVDLRVNAENYLSFYHDDAASFSVSGDGALTAQDVSANENLFYRGTELSELLDALPRGIVYFAEKINDIHTISNASYTSRIGHIIVERPSTPRHWRIVARAGMQSASTGGNVTSGAHWQFVSNGGRVYNQDSWTVLSSVLYQTSGYYWQTETFEDIVNTDDISWDSSGTAIVSWTARNAIGSSYKLGQGAIFYIEDMGPAFDRSPSYPWIRPDESDDIGSSTTPTPRTSTWNMSGFQNYRAGVRLAHTSGNIAGGNYSGEWRGVMFFPHATIKSALSGATISKVEIYLQNAHTYAYAGSTILIGTHNYASAPASSPAVHPRASQHFARGQSRWVTLPNAVGTGFANGSIKGIAVYGGSTANYATWAPSAPKLRITYKK